ncbi:MAG: hypothetical protein MI922_18355, partial [Bacteroidales bacterium]|nr:hypothetical protein [Bacteroidales bacterium]
MKKRAIIVIKSMLAFVILGACTIQPSKADYQVFVNIDYGNNQVQTHKTSWKEGLSVLEALQ